jgi:carboxypeptidase Taq
MVGQSRAYWSWVTPKVHERFPFTKECTAEDFYKAFNRVTPGCIRVESDEVTYPLHVILRYDIERALFRGEMSVDELPEYWNTRMKADLGVDVPDDAQGCLQDIHWSFGAVGYFPSYTLGAVIAVQLFEAAQASIGADKLDAQLAAGEFAPLREWLRENIHSVGSVHPSPDELLTTVCGEGISAKPFLKYLTDKYTELYDL